MQSDRQTRFQQRIQIERRFLSIVNSTLGQHTPLAGMTKDAIASWHNKISEYTDENLVDPVIKILYGISARAALLADNSRDVFERPNGHLSSESVVSLYSLLEASLRPFNPTNN